ncbi:MAG: protease modulator HflC [bacterium]|nr:protease modulator HflC [bacterium]
MTRGRRIVSVIVVLLLAILVYDSIYTVDESEQGVLTHFGKIAPPVKEPGLHFKFPWPVSKVYKVDRRIHPLTNLSQEFITEDQKNVLVDGYLLWRVVDPIRYVKSIRTEVRAVERLSDLYRSSAGIVVSNKPREVFVSIGLEHQDVSLISGEILDLVKPIAGDYGIDVMKVGIVEYTLPPENRPSVIQRMISERARIAARYRSEGEEQAIRIEAFAIHEHEKLMATAHAEATIILGEAEAEAMTTLAAAYSEDPDFYKFIRALDSYDAIIDRNTTLILPADSELFRYLDGDGMLPAPE